jgi:glycine/D-amino acid oxidase-like deaminating enzyme
MAPLPDVLVVGGGLIGCACAHSLAKRGLRVLVLEREDLAAGASGACDGHVCCQSKAPGLHLELARRSLALYRTLADELGEPTGFRGCGSWLIAETPAEMGALARATRERAAKELPVSLQSGDEARAAEPVLADGLAGGSFCSTDGQTDPWLTTLAFYRAATRTGAEFRLGVDAKRLLLDGRRVTGVETSAGPLGAGVVLLAAGAWTGRICAEIGVSLPVRPRRGEILVTEPMPPMLSSIILHAPYVAAKLYDDQERPATLVLEQIEEGNVLIGSTRAYAGYDARNTPQGISAIAGEARRLAPGLADLNVIRSFSGLRPASPDGLPLLGPIPGFDGLFVATGHEGDGIALAPVTGEIVGSSLVEGGNAWPVDLLPARRRGALARLTSGVHAARAGDREMDRE